LLNRTTDPSGGSASTRGGSGVNVPVDPDFGRDGGTRDVAPAYGLETPVYQVSDHWQESLAQVKANEANAELLDGPPITIPKLVSTFSDPLLYDITAMESYLRPSICGVSWPMGSSSMRTSTCGRLVPRAGSCSWSGTNSTPFGAG
jgi:hypothetical protein